MSTVETRNLEEEMFDLIRGIKDPEHPQSLEELKVVYLGGVCARLCLDTDSQASLSEFDKRFTVQVEFTPTVPHCSLATLIGLCIRVKLEQAYPGQLKLDVIVKEGSHTTAAEISKQLNDKERVAAAMENPQMKGMVNECLAYS